MPTGKIEIIYATSERQFIHQVLVDEGDTFRTAIEKSHLLDVFPELDIDTLQVGSYGKLKKISDPINIHDRIEIYRKVTATPKRKVES